MKKNSRNKNRRPQASKVGNREMNQAMLGKRSSNAAGFHVPDTAYRRNPKHKGKGYDYE
jgi:hypothetical protein